MTLVFRQVSSPAFLHILLTLLLFWGVGCSAFATPTASGQFSSTSLGGGVFNYTLTLNNTGTVGANSIGTFWFGWIPGKDFMATSPTNIISPTNWTSQITGGGSGNGYAILWTASTGSADVAPGSSQTFSFNSTDTPAAMAANSIYYPTTPVGTSYVYSGAPFSDSGFQFVVTAAPEPSTLCLIAVNIVTLIGFAPRRARRFVLRQK